MYQFKRSPPREIKKRKQRKKNSRSLSPGRKKPSSSSSRSRKRRLSPKSKEVFVPSNNLYISKKNLKIIYKEKLPLKHEVCGFIERGDMNSLLVNEQENTLILTESDRKSCKTEGYSEIYYHTHPNISKFYPSYEDIRKVMKRNEIMSSIIFTKYGIWEIVRKNRDKYFDNLSEEEKETLEITVKQILDEIYFNNKKGKNLRDLSSMYRDIQILENVINEDYSIDINIHFTLWPSTNYVLKYQGF